MRRLSAAEQSAGVGGHMKYLSILALLFWCFVSPARAQDAGSPEALRAAQELTAILNSDLINQIVAATWTPVEKGVAGKVDAATIAELREEFVRISGTFAREVMNQAPALYARNFTVQELRDMLAFYKTATGVKTLQLMPKVMGEIMGLITPRMPALQQELTDRIQAVLLKHGYKN
jgi:uncharacterized protein